MRTPPSCGTFTQPSGDMALPKPSEAENDAGMEQSAFANLHGARERYIRDESAIIPDRAIGTDHSTWTDIDVGADHRTLTDNDVRREVRALQLQSQTGQRLHLRAHPAQTQVADR